MRFIDKFILHCSASDVESHDNIKTIRHWHVDERGWSDVGYHFFIRKDGTLEVGRPIERIGAHAKGVNKTSIGVCLSGDKNFTELQMNATRKLYLMLLQFIPNLTIHGHCEFSTKTCPNFDYKYHIIDKT